MNDFKTKDKFERPIISLRISITNRCNLNCVYCHHDGMVPSSDEMTPDEIYKVCQIAKRLGINKIRISGGEPLIRKDIVEIIEKIAKLNFKDVSITTNGTLLGKYADDLKKAGLNRINVSLDSLDPEVYEFVTKKDYLDKAKEGIIKSVEAGLYPVKINMVLMNGINENEVKDMFKFSKDHGIILQLIELVKSENCDDSYFSEKYYYDVNPLEENLEKIADEVRVREFMQNRKKYYIDGGELEVVHPIDNKDFCKNCTRLRISPDGKIKPCLLKNDNLVDFVKFIREDYSDEQLEKIFIEGINKREPFYK
ncbi:GTP 3',8-cyclase MoaA [Methanobrevibacter sp. DSM 116169]|uniref:GTP 3',8-cyclase MoaA n=1 Tax=Methanobrevibacter sp. DSM 116169 TaxID=3242727 RepID=UPI0038FBF242